MRSAAVSSLLLLSLVACQDSSGCDDFHPRSGPLALGTTESMDAMVEAGALHTLDVNAGYYVHPQRRDTPDGSSVPDPRLTAPDGPARISVTHDASGLVAKVGDQVVRLDGPIGCD